MSRRVTAAGVVVAAIAAAWAALVYGQGRTMAETVGFSIKASAFGVFVCSIFAIPVMIGIWVAARLLVSGGLGNAVFVAVVAGMAVGSAGAEAAILVDESRFEAEVARDPASDHSRARAWPNRSAGLVYAAGRGIRATD